MRSRWSKSSREIVSNVVWYSALRNQSSQLNTETPGTPLIMNGHCSVPVDGGLLYHPVVNQPLASAVRQAALDQRASSGEVSMIVRIRGWPLASRQSWNGALAPQSGWVRAICSHAPTHQSKSEPTMPYSSPVRELNASRWFSSIPARCSASAMTIIAATPVVLSHAPRFQQSWCAPITIGFFGLPFPR